MRRFCMFLLLTFAILSIGTKSGWTQPDKSKTIRANKTSPIKAQTKAKKQNPKKLLKNGNELFAIGDYSGAYTLYEKGNEISQSPVFLRSMAFCALKLYQHKKAQQLLHEYLLKYPKTKDREKISEVVRGLDLVVQTKLSITSTPAGANLYVNAEAAGRIGVTPFSGTIEPGTHTLILKAPGYSPTIRTFTIKGGETVNLSIPLESHFVVKSDPEGAFVHLDDETSPPVGKTPMESGITPGVHIVYIKTAGYLTFFKKIEVKEKQPVDLSAKLALGFKVNSIPNNASVELDGNLIPGKTPLEIATSKGEHTVIVKLKNYVPFIKAVTVAPGNDADLLVKLRGGLLSMRTDTLRTKVFFDDSSMGEAPIKNVTVPMGVHKLKVQHPERRTWNAALNFDSDYTLDTYVKLGRKPWPLWVSLGATAVGLAMGIGAGVAAINATNEANTSLAYDNNNVKKYERWCYGPGNPVNGYKEDGTPITAGDCSSTLHNTANAGFVIAGTSALFTAIYYYFFVRPTYEVKKIPRD